MEWTVTLSAIGLSAVLTGFSIWRSGRPRKDSLRPRWISWRFMILLGAAILVLSVVHAINLLGIRTGGGMLGGPPRP